MTKNDICNTLAIRNNMTKSEALHIVESFIDILSEAFCEGTDVFIRGFGTFQSRMSKPTVGQDISKGITVQIPARRVVKFKPCQALKKRMQ